METKVTIPTTAEILALQEDVEKHGGDPGADAYYGPVMTHLMYEASDKIPRLGWQEVVVRRTRLCQLGYRSICGALASWDLSVQQALGYLDLGSNHLRDGALIGPYCWNDEILQPGVMLYRQPF